MVSIPDAMGMDTGGGMGTGAGGMAPAAAGMDPAGARGGPRCWEGTPRRGAGIAAHELISADGKIVHGSVFFDVPFVRRAIET